MMHSGMFSKIVLLAALLAHSTTALPRPITRDGQVLARFAAPAAPLGSLVVFVYIFRSDY